MDGEGISEPAAHLPQMRVGEEVVEDYVSTRLSLRAHPVSLLRHLLSPGARPVVVSQLGRTTPDLSKISFTRGNPD